MKIIKKLLCVVIVLSMLATFASCRKISDGYSSNASTVSDIILGEVEIIENDNSSTSTNTSDTQSSISEDSVTNSSDTVQSSNSSTESQIKYEKYTGNLPTISADKIPKYSANQFELSGFWAPYEISEESFKQYKDVGFNTLAMINHSLGNTSEEQFYLGSERTMKALEICKKVGLKAILNYNDWKAEQVEGTGYNGNTPFSTYDLYGEYKDIISGIHICDEPYVRHIEQYGNKTLVEDFKKVYPNAKFIVNLIPYTGVLSRGFESYEQMLQIYEKTFMDPFENPFISVDVYPFHEGNKTDDQFLALNYEYIANTAKKYGIKPGFILQASTGNEFEGDLSEGDLRWEINSALAFGADTLQYYCYSVPQTFNANGTVASSMYDYCILERDGTPSHIYYSLQKLHKEIQGIADVLLSYDWDESLGITGSEDMLFRVSAIQYDENLEDEKFDNPKHYMSATATRDLLISRFTNDKYGEAYMLVNFTDRGNTNNIEVTFRECSSVAIYGGKDYKGTPKIVSLDKNGKFKTELTYGDGIFVVPLV